MKKMLLLFLICSYTIFVNTVEPYDSIETLPYLDHGWFRPENQAYLEKFIKDINPKIIIEVGTWVGLSAMFMAEKLAEGSRLYAVDTFEGSPEHNNIQFLPKLYQHFLSNVKHRGLSHKIVPVKMTSQSAAASLTIKAQLIYVDAAHDYESVYADIIAWYKHLEVGGIMCGDDYGWPGLTQAVHQAAKDLNRKLYYASAFWYFDPKDS